MTRAEMVAVNDFIAKGGAVTVCPPTAQGDRLPHYDDAVLEEHRRLMAIRSKKGSIKGVQARRESRLRRQEKEK